MQKSGKIFVAGHRGLVGSAICRRLSALGYHRFVLRSHEELELRCQSSVEAFFDQEQPEYVFMAAARVGGILANSAQPADFIYDNLIVEANLIHSAYKHGTKKLLFLGSSCIYPKMAPQPLREEYLLSGPLEETNEGYAIAKIAGIKLCQAYNRQYGTDFISVMPTNLYGPGDNFDLFSSHVLPALIRKFDTAKREEWPEVAVWGSGTPRREFLHVDDLADACVFLMEQYSSSEIVNIGTGQDLKICELAELVKSVVGYGGKIVFDTDKPDGTPVKRLDVSRLQNMGWQAKISLPEGIESTYNWYCKHYLREHKLNFNR